MVFSVTIGISGKLASVVLSAESLVNIHGITQMIMVKQPIIRSAVKKVGFS